MRSQAYCELGALHQDGDGVAQDIAAAVRYYKLAVAQSCDK